MDKKYIIVDNGLRRECFLRDDDCQYDSSSSWSPFVPPKSSTPALKSYLPNGHVDLQLPPSHQPQTQPQTQRDSVGWSLAPPSPTLEELEFAYDSQASWTDFGFEDKERNRVSGGFFRRLLDKRRRSSMLNRYLDEDADTDTDDTASISDSIFASEPKSPEDTISSEDIWPLPPNPRSSAQSLPESPTLGFNDPFRISLDETTPSSLTAVDSNWPMSNFESLFPEYVAYVTNYGRTAQSRSPSPKPKTWKPPRPPTPQLRRHASTPTPYTFHFFPSQSTRRSDVKLPSYLNATPPLPPLPTTHHPSQRLIPTRPCPKNPYNSGNEVQRRIHDVHAREEERAREEELLAYSIRYEDAPRSWEPFLSLPAAEVSFGKILEIDEEEEKGQGHRRKKWRMLKCLSGLRRRN